MRRRDRLHQRRQFVPRLGNVQGLHGSFSLFTTTVARKCRQVKPSRKKPRPDVRPVRFRARGYQPGSVGHVRSCPFIMPIWNGSRGRSPSRGFVMRSLELGMWLCSSLPFHHAHLERLAGTLALQGVRYAVFGIGYVAMFVLALSSRPSGTARGDARPPGGSLCGLWYWVCGHVRSCPFVTPIWNGSRGRSPSRGFVMRSLVLGIRICFTENQPGGRASSRAGAGYSVLGIGYLDNVPDIVETRSNNAGG